MSFWKKVKQTAIVDRLVEEQLYEQVLREFESGVRRDGLWAKAFQNSQGDEQKANALYIGYRVQSIKDEAELTDALAGQYEVESKKTHAQLNNAQDEHQQKKTELLKCRLCGCMVSQLIGELCAECDRLSNIEPSEKKTTIATSLSVPLLTTPEYSLPTIFWIVATFLTLIGIVMGVLG
jgi:hypothetical protein